MKSLLFFVYFFLVQTNHLRILEAVIFPTSGSIKIGDGEDYDFDGNIIQSSPAGGIPGARSLGVPSLGAAPIGGSMTSSSSGTMPEKIELTQPGI